MAGPSDSSVGEGAAARVCVVINDCLRRRAAGEAIADDALIAAHPDLRPALGDELRKLRIIAAARADVAAPRVSGVALTSEPGDEIETATFAQADSVATPARLEVRCPGCHVPVALDVDTPLASVTCSSCGGQFSLINENDASQAAPPLAMMGRFELISRVGMGAFGAVWKARDKQLDRTVAIKIPLQGGMTAEDQEKFFREARAAAQLRHPNIVSVHEVGRDGDSVYIVSDFVRGVTLADWLTGQQLTSREAAELCAKIADALHHAHEKSVVHRDLKPANIMIDADGQPHIMDFGLARREVGEVTVTLEGHVLGTPAYMSPEQAQGESHKADRRSDVYSLGVILFELLTSELPFRGNARMLLHQVINDEPTSPRKLNGNVPKDVETISLKCLAKEPGRRYPTAKELSEELRRFLSGEPIHARPISRISRAWRWTKRRPAAAALLAVLSGVAMVGPLVAVQQVALRLQRERVVKQLDDRNVELQDTLTRNLFERACAEYAGGRVSEGIALLAGAYETARPNSSLRTSCRNLMAGWSTAAGKLFRHDEPVAAVAFSHDGRLAITGDDGHVVRLWDCKTGKPVRQPLDHGSNVWALKVSADGSTLLTAGGRWARLWDFSTLAPKGEPFGSFAQNDKWVEAGFWVMDGDISPDAQAVAVAEGAEVRIWNTKTRKAVDNVSRHGTTISCVAFSPDGQRILTASGDNTARLWDVDTGKPLGPPMKHDTGVRAAVFSPDGRTVFTAAGRSVRQWNAESGESLEKTLELTARISALALSPDGETLLVGSEDRTAQLWNVESRTRLEGSFQHDAPINSVAFSADSKYFLTGSLDKTARLWDLQSQKPSNELQLHEDIINDVAFSPDGEYLLTASADGTARLWHADSGKPFGKPMRHKVARTGSMLETLAAVFSPDGRAVLTGSNDMTIRLWDAATGNPRSSPWEVKTWVMSIAFAPDGHTLFVGGARYASFSDARTGKPVGNPVRRTDDVPGVVFSPDGESVLTASSDGRCRIWNVKTHENAGDFPIHAGWVMAAAFNPDGRTAISGSLDATARLWDTKTGQTIGQPMRHFGCVWAAAFSPDGRIALTASDDRTAQYWDAATGQPLGKSMPHADAVTAAAFSPDGRTMVTGSKDGKIRYWNVPQILPDNSKWIAAWAKVQTGLQLNDQSEISRLSQTEWLQALDELEKLRGDLELSFR